MKWLFLLLLTFQAAAADLTWLGPESIDLSTIAPPPEAGTLQDQEDLQTILDWQKMRTEEDCRRASIEAEGLATSFFGPPLGPLTLEEAQSFTEFQEKLFGEIKFFARILKVRFDRPRPYIRTQEIQPCVPLERSNAFPSGHAAVSILAARTLALIYPERSEVLLARARQIALDRVVGGVHHPTDVVAGKDLGEQVFKALLEVEAFRKDVDALKP